MSVFSAYLTSVLRSPLFFHHAAAQTCLWGYPQPQSFTIQLVCMVLETLITLGSSALLHIIPKMTAKLGRKFAIH